MLYKEYTTILGEPESFAPSDLSTTSQTTSKEVPCED